jgi:hypothetical protein
MTVMSWGILAVGMLVAGILALVFGFHRTGQLLLLLTLAAMAGFAVTAGRLQ